MPGAECFVRHLADCLGAGRLASHRCAVVAGLLILHAPIGLTQHLPQSETSSTSLASPVAAERFAAFGQLTYVNQYKPAFGARYSGANSLTSAPERSYSATVTAFLGWRPWEGGELFFNPEAARGIPLSRLAGLGGLTNGELARTSGADWTLYRARLFLRQTWNLAGDREAIAGEANQMTDRLAARRWVFTLGNLSALDIFDDNSYAKDPRTDFLNWSLMSYGAWDYPADARGYSWGAALEHYHDDWVFRIGRFMMPAESNGLKLNTNILRSYGDQIEIARKHEFNRLPGKASLLLFHTRARMGSYQASLNAAESTRTVPELAATRQDRDKWGFGVQCRTGVFCFYRRVYARELEQRQDRDLRIYRDRPLDFNRHDH